MPTTRRKKRSSSKSGSTTSRSRTTSRGSARPASGSSASGGRTRAEPYDDRPESSTRRSSTSSRSSTARGTQPSRTKSTRSRSSYAPQRTSLLGGLSPERKMDLVGAVMALVGLLTILSLFSANRSSLTGSWVGLLATIFGWGAYILPFGLIALGVWLIARNVERLPDLSLERIVGMLLLFFNLLALFHSLTGPTGTAIDRAQAGSGGGYGGALIQRGLVVAVGNAGTAVILIAWLLIALAMTFDLSMQEMFAWAGPVLQNLRQRLDEPSRRTTGHLPSVPRSASEPRGNFVPFQHLPEDAPAVEPPPGAAIRTGIPSGPTITWSLPRVAEILEQAEAPAVNEEFVEQRARLIEETLASFGAPSQVVEISRGPTITMFGVEPLFIETRNGQTRVRVGKIASLADDLALALAAPRIRIQAPVPGRGYVGIEVPNEEMALVALREVVESEVFQRGRLSLRFALGKDVAGHPKAANLESMPHLLIAGTTGSGKSVCVNSILSCFLLHNTPDELRLILVDPKRVELTGYNGVPHLLAPVVVEIERVVGALQWMTREMDNRYHKFAEMGTRNIQDYNTRMSTQSGKKLPHLVVVIDELADLMMIAPDETERTITRLAQLARATGIHMIIATQRPSVDVVTGLIKANFPARIAFAVASNTDSRVILDQPGAERLLGRGDMLFQAPDSPAPVRLQGVFVSDGEINRLVDYWKAQAGASPYAAAGTPGSADSPATSGVPLKQVPMFEMEPEEKSDPLISEATDIVRREGRASISMLQRKLRIGYTRSARLVDTLEEKGIVGPPDQATGVRQVLDYGPAAPPKDA
ncbi:MAG: DNA translocase FtsK 4TM domain-containing protein [Anaerolineales bacterium]|nr:DNA translocase FtsK 4TM domain-containing protein [Anaerolineales bacterium]